MKTKLCLLLSMIILLMSAHQALSQSSSVKIAFKSAPIGDPGYQLPDSPDNVFSVRVPKAYAPWIENPGSTSVSRTADGDSYIFSFTVSQNTSPQIRAVPGGLEINFLAAATNSASRGTPATVTSTPSNFTGSGTPTMTIGVGSSIPVPVATPTPANAGGGAAPALPATTFTNANVKAANIDLSVPESPGFTILGLTPQTVVRPASPREFATSLLNGVDENGNFQTGVALDATPYLLFFGNEVTIQDYRNSYLTQLLSRTQFSFATVKGASDGDKSTKLGLGLNFTLWDNGDPRQDMDLEQCFNTRLGAVISTFKPIPPLSSVAEQDLERKRRTTLLQGAAEECRVESRKKNWGKSSWTVGAAGSWISPTGETRNFKWNGGAFWTSVAYGFEGIKGLDQKAQLIIHLRHRTKEQVPDPNAQGKFFEKDATLFGARLRFGKPTFAGNLEAVYSRDKRAGQPGDNNFRLAVGAERKIADNLYFSLSFGGESKRRDGTGNKTFVLTSFRWGYSKEPEMIQAPQP